MPDQNQFWVRLGKKVQGPFSLEKLKEFAAKKSLKPEMEVSKNQKTWNKAQDIKGLFSTAEKPASTPSKESTAPSPPKNIAEKSIPALSKDFTEDSKRKHAQLLLKLGRGFQPAKQRAAQKEQQNNEKAIELGELRWKWFALVVYILGFLFICILLWGSFHGSRDISIAQWVGVGVCLIWSFCIAVIAIRWRRTIRTLKQGQDAKVEQGRKNWFALIVCTLSSIFIGVYGWNTLVAGIRGMNLGVDWMRWWVMFGVYFLVLSFCFAIVGSGLFRLRWGGWWLGSNQGRLIGISFLIVITISAWAYQDNFWRRWRGYCEECGVQIMEFELYETTGKARSFKLCSQCVNKKIPWDKSEAHMNGLIWRVKNIYSRE